MSILQSQLKQMIQISHSQAIPPSQANQRAQNESCKLIPSPHQQRAFSPVVEMCRKGKNKE